ncbi:MAG: hypothetical protein AAGG00_20695 [Cyanobacteria bacterium P01_H01_bin.150]
MVDMTQMVGEYAASWLPWIMIPLIFYILPFPVFAILFLWVEKEDIEEERTDIPVNQMMGNVTNMDL